MQHLLVQDTFDSFLICDGEINTSNTFSINGRINRDFYNSDELKTIDEDFVAWKNLKHICFEIIKGKKVPTEMKLVLTMPKSRYSQIAAGTLIVPNNISGLYIHILYESNAITVITGTSLNIFSMDKSVDKIWDNMILKFLSQHFNISEL